MRRLGEQDGYPRSIQERKPVSSRAPGRDAQKGAVMRSATRLAVFVSILAFLTFSTVARAAGPNGNGNGNAHIPKLVIDSDGSHLTPLAKGFSSTAQKHRDKARANGHPDCTDPSPGDNPGQRRKKAKDCDTEDVNVINAPDPDKCPHCGSENITDT